MQVLGKMAAAGGLVLAITSAGNAGLVAHYTFDGNTADASGNGYNATAHGGASYIAGKVGSGAMAFDGVVNSYVDAPYAPALTLADTNYTVAFWLNLAEVKEQSAVSVFDDQASENGGFSLLLRSDGSYQSLYNGGGQTHKFPYDTSGDPNAVNLSEAVGTWKQYTLVYDRDADTRSLYVDGVFKASAPTTADVVDPGSGRLILGALFNVNIGHFFSLHGALDDVRLYDEALSASAVQQLVPEPAALAFLGLGAMAVLRRRPARARR